MKEKNRLIYLLITVSIVIFLSGFKLVNLKELSTEFEKPGLLLLLQDDLRIFSFKSQESKILPGLSTEKKSAYNCSGIISDNDKIGNIALLALFYQNGCYTDGKYNHRNFKVERGNVTDSKNELRFDAYRIYEPSDKALKFLASHHCLAYKFPKNENYSVYELAGKKINKVADIKASEISKNEYILIKELKVSKIKGYRTYFFAPTNQRISVYTQYSEKVEGARIKETELGNIFKYRYQVNYTPYDRSVNYSNTRQFFLFKENKNILSAIWQDKEKHDILLSRFGKNLKSETNTKLVNPSDAQLIAATNDESGNFYYLTVKSDKKGNSDIVMLYKIDNNGHVIMQVQPETSKSGLNIFRFNNYMADMEFLDGQLGLFIARTMHKSGDGLNHQGGIAVVFDANNLTLIKNFGQTSGHSFDNYLTYSSKGEFIGIDLGDNYPRGIHLHKFTSTQRKSKIIYTFKTQHGSSAKSPAGKTYTVYSEISGSGKKYYKWSNDNGTYTSLGALIETDDGYVVLFTGEPDPNGKSINNARIGGKSQDPRNIGFIKIVKDFGNSSGKGNVVSDDMVLSKGITESGGFYTFGGRWSEQRNTGVNWLTNYKTKSIESAVNLKAIKLKDENILLLWEKHAINGYNSQYFSTFMMKIDKNGKKLSEQIDIGSHVRLNRRDELLRIDNEIYLVSGNKKEKKLELIVFDNL